MLWGMWNFKPGFINGSRNLRISSVKDHMIVICTLMCNVSSKKASSSSLLNYAPIAKALHKLDAATEIIKKFEIAHYIAKENLSLLKMGPLCELVERQGIDIGQNYKNDKACSMFVHLLHKILSYSF